MPLQAKNGEKPINMSFLFCQALFKAAWTFEDKLQD